MSEFILELYSEEIPPNLQINARNDLETKIKSSLIEENLKFGSLKAFSSPTRILSEEGIGKLIGVIRKQKD